MAVAAAMTVVAMARVIDIAIAVIASMRAAVAVTMIRVATVISIVIVAAASQAIR